MADKKDKDKDKKDAKPKPKPKPDAQAQAKEKKPKDKEKEKAKKEEAAAAALAEAAKPKEPEAPRPPADPRLKVLKKFRGRFLPKGPLRDRLKVLMDRWNSGEDHGGVTFEELKALHNDWKASREKKPKAKAPATA